MQCIGRTAHAASCLLLGLFCLTAFANGSQAGDGGSPRVTLVKTPDGGIQPQAVVDDRGNIHLIDFKGDPAAGNLFYSRLDPGDQSFTSPVRVNSQPGSAIAMGTIRGGQVAVGKDGRVHVAWNGTRRALPRPPAGGEPMLYSRSIPGGTDFEPQRNLMQKTTALDGGGTVAADREGRVFVAWHGRAEDAPRDEAARRMWVARSSDDGATFDPEVPAVEQSTGACACCGTRALADRRGGVFMLYRAATAAVERDMILLSSGDHGASFIARPLDPWRIGICPMSSVSLAETRNGVVAAWETDGQVKFLRLDPDGRSGSPVISPPGPAKGRKHPALAANAKGEVLLVWTEGTGWQKGGALAWRLFDPSGRPTEETGTIEGGVPVWGLATVVAMPDGRFVIVH
jgi:hypothetical protein